MKVEVLEKDGLFEVRRHREDGRVDIWAADGEESLLYLLASFFYHQDGKPAGRSILIGQKKADDREKVRKEKAQLKKFEKLIKELKKGVEPDSSPIQPFVQPNINPIAPVPLVQPDTAPPPTIQPFVQPEIYPPTIQPLPTVPPYPYMGGADWTPDGGSWSSNNAKTTFMSAAQNAAESAAQISVKFVGTVQGTL